MRANDVSSRSAGCSRLRLGVTNQPAWRSTTPISLVHETTADSPSDPSGGDAVSAGDSGPVAGAVGPAVGEVAPVASASGPAASVSVASGPAASGVSGSVTVIVASALRRWPSSDTGPTPMLTTVASSADTMASVAVRNSPRPSRSSGWTRGTSAVSSPAVQATAKSSTACCAACCGFVGPPPSSMRGCRNSSPTQTAAARAARATSAAIALRMVPR